MDTGSKIKQLRETSGMTQEELGKLLGVKKAAINKYETGTVVNLKRSTIEGLCSIFNVTPQFLLSDSDTLSSTSPLQLSEQEERLIIICRKLNGDGQGKLLEYGHDLVASGRYGLSELETRMWKDADEIAQDEYRLADTTLDCQETISK